MWTPQTLEESLQWIAKCNSTVCANSDQMTGSEEHSTLNNAADPVPSLIVSDGKN